MILSRFKTILKRKNSYHKGQGFLFLDGKTIKLLGIIHHQMIFPVHVKDQNNVVFSSSVGQQAQHGYSTLTWPGLDNKKPVNSFLNKFKIDVKYKC